MAYCRQVLATRRPKVTCAWRQDYASRVFRFFGCSALMLSATAATWFPQAALAVSKVKVTGMAKVNITNIPSVNLNGTPIVRLEAEARWRSSRVARCRSSPVQQ